jgi:hypothetical protein
MGHQLSSTSGRKVIAIGPPLAVVQYGDTSEEQFRFSILDDRSARHYFSVYILDGIFSFLYLAFFNLGCSSNPT